MTVAIVAEKPSAAANFAKALGGFSGTYKGTKYMIVNLRGHLFSFAEPHDMLKDKSQTEVVRQWTLNTLPWSPQMFTWQRISRDDSEDLIKSLKQTLSSSSITEIVNGADLDPTGEGDLLFWEVMDELNLHHKTFTRMEFVDESEKSLRLAFENRRPIISMQDEGGFRKADARSKMDLLTVQHTRVASLLVGQNIVLRQGRLKSAMVKLVGDQYEAWKNYVKKPYFQNRFIDNHDVVYTNPAEPQFASKSQVSGHYSPSSVTVLSKTIKSTKPPKLIDLAGLSARLSSRGISAANVLAVYQKMYEAKIVSYPRTEDKTITFEQFDELLPYVDAIAHAVGVAPQLLTHRQPRSSHVKDSGAHGANRPGVNVPVSMLKLQSEYGATGVAIYEILARNYLAMLAPDYQYEHQKGCVTDYPKFIGYANVPKVLGWRQVFSFDDMGEEDTVTSGLGDQAKPFVYEGANPRPQHPTLRWLMNQLEQRSVGTGATRTSIYADTISKKHKFPLLEESRGKITPTKYGVYSHRMLKDTKIGDLSATETFYDLMNRIEKGQATTHDGLEMVTSWVQEDIEVMRHNSAALKKEFKLQKTAEYVAGVWQGEVVKINRNWGDHYFTDAEVQALLNDETISFSSVSNAGSPFTATGKLDRRNFETPDGKVVNYVGFGLIDNGNRTSNDPSRVEGVWQSPTGPRQVRFKRVFRNYELSDAEVASLLAGEEIPIYDLTAKTGNKYSVSVHLADSTFTNDEGKLIKYVGVQQVGFINKPGVPDSFGGVTFTDAQKRSLEKGEKIFVKGLKSTKSGRDYNATISYGLREDGQKGLILEFG